ncbi:MAG: glucose PTS transporter subunit IIA [Lachnospiraceae bacterium]|nr:glucose PTS transporter subunit IIA [Lachnospiraceae bacterium]
MDYRKSAKEVLEYIGGSSNIVSAAHCATRLRLVIADNTLVDKAKIENVDGVKGCFEASGQLQVIFGTGIVNHVYDEFIDLAGIQGGSKEDVKAAAASKQNIFFRAIKTLGDIFVPIIPAIVASGLLNGLLGGLSNAYPAIAETSAYEIINLFAGAALSMLPILIAISAAKKFGGNEFLAAVIGFIMIHPSLINAWSVASMVEAGEKVPSWSVWFGAYSVDQVGYQGHVIPVIIAIFLMSWLEKKLHKIVPAMLDLFVTPLVSVLVTGYLTLTIIGPVFSVVEKWVVNGAQSLIGLPFGIGGILIGGLYALTVVAGLHHMYNMIEAEMCSLATPMNTWMPIATAANVGQGAAALAVGVKTKNAKIKSMAMPASLSAFLGITEPAIFGVNIRFMKPFVAGCIGGAAGGFVAAISGVFASAYGITGLFGYLITTKFVLAYTLVMVVSFVVSFVVSWILYKDEETEEPKAEEEPVEIKATEPVKKEELVINPMNGEVKPLNQVPDDTFSSGVLGVGVAVEPIDGNLFAPVSGVVSTVFPTKHAIGITSETGAEILIHMGLNTVELDGKYFDCKVAEGDKVKAGDLISTWEIDEVRRAGYETITPIIVTNPDDFIDIVTSTQGNKIGETIINLAKL